MTTVVKPWGREEWFAHTSRYAGKILHITAGERLSVQYHREKDETSMLLSGRIEIATGPTVDALAARIIEPGGAWRVPALTVHTVSALEDSVIVEVSTPELDDVVRLDDRYGRCDG